MAVLIHQNPSPVVHLVVGRTPLVIENRAAIHHLQTRPERDAETIPESVVVPSAIRTRSTLGSKQMLIQKVIGYRERPRFIHLCRWAIEQAGSAIRKLSVSGRSQKGQNQYEGYAFYDAKLERIPQFAHTFLEFFR